MGATIIEIGVYISHYKNSSILAVNIQQRSKMFVNIKHDKASHLKFETPKGSLTFQQQGNHRQKTLEDGAENLLNTLLVSKLCK